LSAMSHEGFDPLWMMEQIKPGMQARSGGDLAAQGVSLKSLFQ